MTQKSEHTPTPWKLQRDPTHFDSLSTIVGGEVTKKWPYRELIVEVGGSDSERQEANARLIVHRVNTWEAMREALEGIESTYVFLESLTTGIEPQHTNTVKALNAVRAALKAGETNARVGREGE